MTLKSPPFYCDIKSMIIICQLLIFCWACDDKKNTALTMEIDQGSVDLSAGEQADDQLPIEQAVDNQAGNQISEQVSDNNFDDVTEDTDDESQNDDGANDSPHCESQYNEAGSLVALSFPYAETLGEDGLSIQVYRFENEQLIPWGNRLVLEVKTSAFLFSKDGWWLIALGEQGSLTSIDLRGDIPIIGTQMDLVSGDYSMIERGAKERQFDVINSNSNEFSGIYSLKLNCDGSFMMADDFYYLRLIQGYKRAYTAADQVFVFGGQALFDPIDLIDVRWLSAATSEAGTTWSELSTLDIFEDFIDAINLGLSPLNNWLTVVNGSPFTEEGGQVHFIEIQQEPPSLREAFVFEGYSDVRGAWYLPQGDTVMITQLEANAVQLFTNKQDEWTVGQRIEGIGLANQCAFLSPSGATDGMYALLPSVSPSGGSGVSILNILDGENVMSLPTIPLGDGYINIPEAIAAWPVIE